MLEGFLAGAFCRVVPPTGFGRVAKFRRQRECHVDGSLAVEPFAEETAPFFDILLRERRAVAGVEAPFSQQPR